MLAGIYYGSQYGGSTTSILLRIPGEAASVMTCIDGNAMARKGRAGAALCIAAVGSFIAGTFGVIVLTLVAPPLAAFALRLRPARIHRAARARPDLPRLHVDHLAHPHAADGGVRTAARHHRHRRDDRALPLSRSTSPSSATASASCRWRSACSGSARLLATPSRQVTGDVTAPKLRELLADAARNGAQSAMPIARGSVLGFLIGIIPGSAHIISSFMSYALERRSRSSRRNSARARWPASPVRNRPTTPPRPARSCRCWRSACRPGR